MWGCAPVSEREARATSDGTGPLRVAYVMSRFPKLTETFILFEMIAVERQGVAVELFPLLRERTSTIHPEASALVDRARFLPFLSWSIVKSQLWFLRHRPRRYLRTIGAIVRGTWRSPNFLLGGLGILPKVAHAARLMRAMGVDHVHCHFANHPAMAGLDHPPARGPPLQLHGTRLRPARRSADALREGIRRQVRRGHLGRQPSGHRARNARPPWPIGSRSSIAAWTHPCSGPPLSRTSAGWPASARATGPWKSWRSAPSTR